MVPSPPMDLVTQPLILVALGGALGGVARFWVSGLVARRFGERFPWGTLVVNVTGSSAIGALAVLALDPAGHAVLRQPLWLGLAVGLLGSYTTVSSFALQTLSLAQAREGVRAALNVALSVLLCLAAAASGYAATAALVGR
jgi:CrcB protein